MGETINLDKKEGNIFYAPGVCPVCHLTMSPKPVELEMTDMIGCGQCCSIFMCMGEQLDILDQDDLNGMPDQVRDDARGFAKMVMRLKSPLN